MIDKYKPKTYKESLKDIQELIDIILDSLHSSYLPNKYKGNLINEKYLSHKFPS